MYHVFVHSLAHRVLGYIRQEQLLSAGDRVGVAVSGGIDSVALLRLLLELRGELGLVVSVVHFNHKLRGAESDADEQFVAALARDHDLEFFCDGDDVAGHAREEGVSVETAARELRYGFFRYLVGEERDTPGLKPESVRGGLRGPKGPLFHHLDKIGTGHTLDDQAETVLMRMIRGAGLRGIGGIYPRIAVEDEDGEFCGEIVRPLLSIGRRELEQYLREIGQAWREDATNLDEKFTRNRVRKLLVPLLEKEFNPAVAESLAELAEIARGEEDYWENEIAGWMGTGVHWSEPAWARQPAPGLVQIGLPDGDKAPEELRSKIENTRWLVMNASVDRLWFLGEPIAVQRRVVKAMGERAGIPLEFKHVEEILRFAAEEGASGKELSLPLGWKMVCELDELVFLTPDLRQPAPSQDYEYELPLPGEVAVSEAGSLIEVKRVAPGGEAYNPEHLLDADSLPGRLKVRNWRAGDRFWPAHTKSPKKVKELLQERHVAQPERRLWPVVLSGDEIVWMRGFPLPARYQAKPGHEGVLIRERTVAAASE
ncbi:MAG TPA: tRNA lysidine(34) synthetase TilS [Candidatus Sulfotelmatobacter sp.]|nr:tRNA lysidine(34) synthetase TilS [Candidatus Sulfotelmatobacter sp.]